MNTVCWVQPQVDLQLESGEYFLAQQERAKRSKTSQQAQQAERTAERKRKRQEAFVAPQVSHARVTAYAACGIVHVCYIYECPVCEVDVDGRACALMCRTSQLRLPCSRQRRRRRQRAWLR